MDMHRHALDEGFGQKHRQRDGADQKRKGDDLRGDDAGQSEHGNLDDADRDRDYSVGGDYRRTFEARGHQQRQQDHARARGAADHDAVADRAGAKPGVTDPMSRRFAQTTQRHA